MQPMTPAGTDALRDEIRRLGPWHYDIEIAPGVRTGDPVPPGTYPAGFGTPSVIDPFPALDYLADTVYGGDFGGRTFLDCACNAGGYLFAASRRGAGRCFGFDVREHWIEQARFLTRHLGGANLEFDVCDLLTLPSRGLPQFDVTLFSGIFYHLPDPIAGLRIAADHTRELLVLNTAITPQRRHALILNPEAVDLVMSGVHRLAWLPTSEKVLRSILEWCGFPHTRTFWFQKPAGTTARIQIVAARESGTFARYDAVVRRPRTVRNRIRRLLGRG